MLIKTIIEGQHKGNAPFRNEEPTASLSLGGLTPLPLQGDFAVQQGPLLTAIHFGRCQHAIASIPFFSMIWRILAAAPTGCLPNAGLLHHE